MQPNCGCCRTGTQYVRRHLDPRGNLPLRIDAAYLARELLAMYDGFVPAHVPALDVLTAWIRDAQRERQSRLRACA